VNRLRELVVLGIPDPHQKKSNEEAEMLVRAHFLDTRKVNGKGWYEAKLLWIEGHPPLPWNFSLARKG
jgi:hypothetical protein